MENFIKYKYHCQPCNAVFYREIPNANEKCGQCGRYVFFDWRFDFEKKLEEYGKPERERSRHYRDGPDEG